MRRAAAPIAAPHCGERPRRTAKARHTRRRTRRREVRRPHRPRQRGAVAAQSTGNACCRPLQPGISAVAQSTALSNGLHCLHPIFPLRFRRLPPLNLLGRPGRSARILCGRELVRPGWTGRQRTSSPQNLSYTLRTCHCRRRHRSHTYMPPPESGGREGETSQSSGGRNVQKKGGG